MTFNQLIYFQKAAELENYHLASEELHISQPSLSRSIASLEQELGVVLFQKAGRGVVLTKAGKIFLQYCNEILSNCARAEEKMEELASGGGKIDVGFVFPLAWHFIPNHISQFLKQKDNQNVSFSLVQDITPVLADLVKKGQLDVGFGGALDDPELESLALLNQELVMISSRQSDLPQGPLKLKTASEYPLVSYDPNSWMGQYSQQLFADHHLTPKIIAWCPDEYSITALVRNNTGIAIVPRTDLLEQTPEICIHPIIDLKMSQEIYMFWKKDCQRLPAADRFIRYMKTSHSKEVQ